RRPRALEGTTPGGGGAAPGGRHPRRLDARPVHDLDAHPGQPAPRSRDGAPGRGAARPRLRSVARLATATGAEHALQLVGGRDLQVVVAAVPRALVGAPAQELGGVPEASPLHVVVSDLADALGPERLPAQVLAAIPATGGAGEPLSGLARLLLRLGP